MLSPTLSPERRQSPRTTVTRLAYINLDSHNGAIVLNVSAEGLCFHSVAPVQKSDAIRFWFSEDHRIQVDGQLAWINEKQKTGGMRFSNLSTDARRQIREWMSQPPIPAAAGAKLAPSLSSPSELPKLSVKASAPLADRSPDIKVPALLSGFSAGLVFGILVSILVAAALLLRAYPREFGSSLIQLGERLRGRSQTQTVSPTEKTTTPAPVSNPSHAKSPAQPQTRAIQTLPLKAVAPVLAPRAPTTASSVSPGPALPPPTPSPKSVVEPAAGEVPTMPGAPSKPESANHPSDHIENSRAEETRAYSTMYLEVGRFHDITWADQATNKLEQLGFPATVVHKGHFWMNSYEVLVGPYDSDDEARAARQDLVSRGFTPKAYERGSRNISFPAGLSLHGTRIPVDDCVVSWESYVSDAIVKIERGGNVVATVEGRWVKRGAKFEWNTIVYQRNPDGSRTLLEIRFAGMTRALVFGES
jgi:cell division protein FtsN